jgi:hypothetical protein
MIGANRATLDADLNLLLAHSCSEEASLPKSVVSVSVQSI